MIQVGETATLVTEDGAVEAALRERFRDEHAVKLRGFLEPGLLAKVQSHLREAVFVPKEHGGIGHELVCWDSPAADVLTFVLNDPRLFAWITSVTGVGPIGCFVGRVYRMTAADAHHETWHSDEGDHRLLALSVNVGEQPHRGGTTLLREQGRPETTRALDNTTPGDALLFRISATLEHAITDVAPGAVKTAWAGWFRSHPSFLDVLAGKTTF